MNNNRSGIVLLITLVILVVLSTIGYTLSSRVTAARLRNQYLIDYSKARYGCDSALKYALATMEEIQPVLISRPNEPDFSDLYALNPNQYEDFMNQWKAIYKASESENKKYSDSEDTNDMSLEDEEKVSIPGPYGAAWPLIGEPAEFEIGTAKVRIEIEDENAKYPLGWAMIEDNTIQKEVDAGFETFCEMSGLNSEQITALRKDMDGIKKYRPFKTNFEPVVTTTRTPVRTTSTSKSSTSSKSATSTQIKRTVLTVATQAHNQTTIIGKLFNSGLLDKEVLIKPTIIGDDRQEYPLKYISIWGTRLVNINTAPRQVLEAAFTFGGDQVKIADQIIQLRKIQPFENIEDLQDRIMGYTDAIEKSKTYITTSSRLFTIRITAVSGLAKATSLIAITKDGNTVKRIATVNN